MLDIGLITLSEIGFNLVANIYLFLELGLEIDELLLLVKLFHLRYTLLGGDHVGLQKLAVLFVSFQLFLSNI